MVPSPSIHLGKEMKVRMKSETMIWPFVEADLLYLLHQHPSFPDPLVVYQAGRNDVRVFSLFPVEPHLVPVEYLELQYRKSVFPMG